MDPLRVLSRIGWQPRAAAIRSATYQQGQSSRQARTHENLVKHEDIRCHAGMTMTYV